MDCETISMFARNGRLPPYRFSGPETLLVPPSLVMHTKEPDHGIDIQGTIFKPPPSFAIAALFKGKTRMQFRYPWFGPRALLLLTSQVLTMLVRDP